MEEAGRDLKPYDDARLCYATSPSMHFGIHATIPPAALVSLILCTKKMALKATDLVVSSNFLFEIDVKVKDSYRIFAKGAYVKGCDSWLIYHEGASLSNEFNTENAMMPFSTLP